MMKKHFFIPYVLQIVGHALGLAAFKLFCRLEVTGREHLEGLGQGVIIAANHVSELDPILVRAALPLFSRFSPLYYVSGMKESFKDFRRFGWRSFIYGGTFFEMLGGYPIYRGHHDYAYSLQNHLDLLKQKRTVCIFPEGRRSSDGRIGRAHGGVAYLAWATGSPIVPVAITGHFKITAKSFFLRRTKLKVTVGRSFAAADLVQAAHPNPDDFRHAAQVVMDSIEMLGHGYVPGVVAASAAVKAANSVSSR